MVKSILIGLILPSLIIFSGWIRVLFYFLFRWISPSFGNGIPYLYFFLGITFGLGKSYDNYSSYWVTYLSGMIFSVLILTWSFKNDRKNGGNSSTVSNCGSHFFGGGVIGMIIGLFI
jgi:hypothetical protein